MNCIKCYQEIPDGSKFCPHCGAQQPEAGPVHAEAGAAAESVKPAEDAAQQTENSAQQTENTAQQTYDSGYQYQQSGPVYQSEPTPIYQQPVNHEPINWVPYLVLSIISTLCVSWRSCLPRRSTAPLRREIMRRLKRRLRQRRSGSSLRLQWALSGTSSRWFCSAA